MRSTSETIELKPSWRALVEEILGRHVPGSEVWAFGSRVTGRAKRYSDLDLAIVDQTVLSSSVLGELQEEFQESDLPIRVDLVDWHRLDSAFQAIIAQRDVVLQAPPERRAGAP